MKLPTHAVHSDPVTLAAEALDEFLIQFPTVTRDQTLATLEQARDSVLADTRPA